jgi:alkanesulfonate monooxygenase SsuD/methylene tetrahydromethanopterin reductase-like flavin-dependent oxidoreductase (luciferase family)
MSAQHRLKVGLFLPLDEAGMHGTTPRWSDLRAMAHLAEQVGFDSLWLPDHLLYRFAGSPPTGQWECLTMLAALAAVTEQIQLGTLVVSTSFREPAILAKIIDAVDEISHGRVVLGLGAGYHKPEYDAFGFPYDHRASRFEEALTIVAGLLRTGSMDFSGRYYQVKDCVLRPRGPRVSGPPIIIGTQGERMLRVTARLADGWNAWLAFEARPFERLPGLLSNLMAACEAVGRDPATLRRSITLMIDPLGNLPFSFGAVRPGIAHQAIIGPPAAIVAALHQAHALGIDEVQVYLPTADMQAIEAFRPSLEALHEH